MAAPVTPAKKLSNGKDTWWLVPTIADMSAPTVAEVNATTGMNLAGSLLSDFEGVTSSTDKVSIARVLAETTETEVNGATTFSSSDMQITFQPQAASGDDGKKAWELTENGFVGFAVRRQDVAASTGDTTAGEFLDIVPVELSRPIPGKTTTGPDGIYIFTSSVSVTGTPKFNKAVVA